MTLPVHDTFHNKYIDRYLEREQQFINQYAQEYDEIQKWHANLFTFLEARREPLILKASQSYRQVKDGALVVDDIILMANQLKKFFKSTYDHQTKPALCGSTLHSQNDKHPNITVSGLVDPSMLQLASLAMGIYDGTEYSEEAMSELDAIVDEVKGAVIEDRQFDEIFTKIDEVHNQRKLCDMRLAKYGNMIQWYQRRQHDFKSLTALRKERGGDIFHARHKYFKSIVNVWKMHMRVCRLVNQQLAVILKANQQRQLFATRNVNRITNCLMRYHTSSLHRLFQCHAQQQFAPTQAYNYAKQTGFFVNPDGGDPIQPPGPVLTLIPGNLLNPDTYRQSKDDIYAPRVNAITTLAQTEAQQNHGHSGPHKSAAVAPSAPSAPSVPVNYSSNIDVSGLDAQYLDGNGNLNPYIESGYDQTYADNPFDPHPQPYNEAVLQHTGHVADIAPAARRPAPAPVQEQQQQQQHHQPEPQPQHQVVSGYPAEAPYYEEPPYAAPGLLPCFEEQIQQQQSIASGLSNDGMMTSIEREINSLQVEESMMDVQESYDYHDDYHDDDDDAKEINFEDELDDDEMHLITTTDSTPTASTQNQPNPLFTPLDPLPQSFSFSTLASPQTNQQYYAQHEVIHQNGPLANPSSVATAGLAPGTFAEVQVDPNFDWAAPTPGIKVKYYPFYPHPVACNTTVPSKPVPNAVKSQFERYKFLGGVQELVMRSRRVAPPGPLPPNQTILMQTRATKKTTFNEIQGDLIYTKTHQMHFLLDKPVPGTDSSSKPRSADTDIDDADYDKYVKTWGPADWVIDACYVISRHSKNDVYRIIFKEHLPGTFSRDHEYKLLFQNQPDVAKWVDFVNDHNRFGPEQKMKK